MFHNFHHVINNADQVVLRLQDGLFSPEDTQAVVDKIMSLANMIRYDEPPLHLYSTELPNYTHLNGVPLKNWSLQGKDVDVFPTVPDSFRLYSNNVKPYMFPVTTADESYYSATTDGYVAGGLENPNLFLKNFFKSNTVTFTTNGTVSNTDSFLSFSKMRYFDTELSSAVLSNLIVKSRPQHTGINVGYRGDTKEDLFFKRADQFVRAYTHAISTYDVTHRINSPVPSNIDPDYLIHNTTLADYYSMWDAFYLGIPTIACSSLIDSHTNTLKRLARSVNKSGTNSLELVFLTKLGLANIRGYGSYDQAKELYDNWYLSPDNPHTPIGGGYLRLHDIGSKYIVDWVDE